MQLRNKKVGTGIGLLSILLSIVSVFYIFQSETFPQHALTEEIVLLGGVGGSVLAALSAGLIGSRWWFLATLAAAMDIGFLWGFSP